MTEETILTITDKAGNALAEIPFKDNKIDINTIAEYLINKFAYMNIELMSLRGAYISLCEDVEDLKEAHEHTDDSLSNLRERVDNHIHGGNDGTK